MTHWGHPDCDWTSTEVERRKECKCTCEDLMKGLEKMSIFDTIKERDALIEKVLEYFGISTYYALEDMSKLYWKIEYDSICYSGDKDNIEEYQSDIRSKGAIVRKDDAVAIPFRDCFGESGWYVFDAAKEVKEEES